MKKKKQVIVRISEKARTALKIQAAKDRVSFTALIDSIAGVK